ncbi:MAG: 5-formyltetrahydrofolate cyclo-ligase [Endomicrobium sp.]|jgi:5-formyltetrahydrofolate cyclo-ligase|nr:5-formyltetrahydrofolate cyclo-ligase [Endomicrobium sp.]
MNINLKYKKRIELLSIRNNMSKNLILSKSFSIFNKIKKLNKYNLANSVMFYLSFNSEVITDYMIKHSIENNKVISVPAIANLEKNVLFAIKISKLEDANQIVYKIRQPNISSFNIINKNSIDLIFVPGIAFDYKGYRLGYGKGYYDRWLYNIPKSKIIGLAYDFQIIDKVPINTYDLPVGSIITEKRIITV